MEACGGGCCSSALRQCNHDCRSPLSPAALADPLSFTHTSPLLLPHSLMHAHTLHCSLNSSLPFQSSLCNRADTLHFGTAPVHSSATAAVLAPCAVQTLICICYGPACAKSVPRERENECKTPKRKAEWEQELKGEKGESLLVHKGGRTVSFCENLD